ncbi:MAG: SUMF1/EgtB/PvdO family nonheme iron enzyme, partial [bacterium]|nr:SUMF1/EgtB/PvdO family nonheme iron enzyme [bacterium]
MKKTQTFKACLTLLFVVLSAQLFYARDSAPIPAGDNIAKDAGQKAGTKDKAVKDEGAKDKDLKKDTPKKATHKISADLKKEPVSTTQPANNNNHQSIKLETKLAIAALFLALVGFIFGIYQWLQRNKFKREEIKIQQDADDSRENEKQETENKNETDTYRESLRVALNKIRMVGPQFPKYSASLCDTFVSLNLSHHIRGDNPYPKDAVTHRTGKALDKEALTPGQVMKLAFRKCRMLLIIGEPGSGKTTLMQHYALTCLDNKHKTLGFKEEQILPIYYPLRELTFYEGRPRSLQESLAEKGHERFSKEQFKDWLKQPNTLILLDGLDEISDEERRKKVCRWITKAWEDFPKTRFLLTTRPTGFRKVDGFELECDYFRAEVLDFDTSQQADFLNRWFKAVSTDELRRDASVKQKEYKEKEAEKQANALSDYLARDDNNGIAQLARVPMLLQIMAILWKDHLYLPENRGKLYEIALNYLLEYRDNQRDIKPLLTADKALPVLSLAALKMHEELKSHFAPKSAVHAWMNIILGKMDKPPKAVDFCVNCRDRAGVIADYAEESYIFSHKSFMEYLAALQLLKECRESRERINVLIETFNDEGWIELLRFFICKGNENDFDRFMSAFFNSEASRELKVNKRMLLEQLVREAPLKKIDALDRCLKSPDSNDNQKRHILKCLKLIDTRESIAAVYTFYENNKEDVTASLAKEIVLQMGEGHGLQLKTPVETASEKGAPGTAGLSFHNHLEDNAEYIKIPGGSFNFSLSKTTKEVPDIYFCKYPVTNKRYRKFISYLGGGEKEIQQLLPLELYSGTLLDFAATVKGYSDYLGRDVNQWQEKLRSIYDNKKSFNGSDQPVVSVTWYAARAYCLWLSLMYWQEKAMAGTFEPKMSIEKVSAIYRLPTEVEWEWAASGRGDDGKLRKYPWGNNEPTSELANYDSNVEATTPVGSYTGGATPEGLMDMAGNVWEWMGHLYDDDKDLYALRGGSWGSDASSLACGARLSDDPAS